MPIILKTAREIASMRRTGQVGCEILSRMIRAAAPGVSTQHLDDLARIELEKVGGIALSRNYPTYKPGEGFPGYTCISINEEVVHGIPGKRQLRDGDVVTLDLALSVDGFCCDMATTIGVGRIDPVARRLLDVTRDTLSLALQLMKPGKRWSDIARLMQYNVEQAGFSVVREFVGHGIGRKMHEDPKVANFVTSDFRGDFKLRPGMTLAVEPMVVAGRRDVKLLADNWTVVTEDRQPAAHFEHTVAVTDDGIDVLTNGRCAWGVPPEYAHQPELESRASV